MGRKDYSTAPLLATAKIHGLYNPSRIKPQKISSGITCAVGEVLKRSSGTQRMKTAHTYVREYRPYGLP